MSEALLPTVLPLGLQSTTEIARLPNDQSSGDDAGFYEFFTKFSESITSSDIFSIGSAEVHQNPPSRKITLPFLVSVGNDGTTSIPNEEKSFSSVSHADVGQSDYFDQEHEDIYNFKFISQSDATTEEITSQFDKGSLHLDRLTKKNSFINSHTGSGDFNKNALSQTSSSLPTENASHLPERLLSVEIKSRVNFEDRRDRDMAFGYDKIDTKLHAPFAVEGNTQSKTTELEFRVDNTKQAQKGSKLARASLEARTSPEIIGGLDTRETITPFSLGTGQKVGSEGASSISLISIERQDLVVVSGNEKALAAKASKIANDPSPSPSPSPLSHPPPDENLVDSTQRHTIDASNHSASLSSPLGDQLTKSQPQSLEVPFAKSSVSIQSPPDKLTAVFADIDFGPVQSAQTAANSQNLSPSPAPTPTSPPQMIAQQLNASLPRNNDGLIVTPSSTEFALDPPELGRIRIVVTDSAQGPVMSITAERSETMDLMRRHADLLRDEFMRDGLGDANLQFSNQNGSESAGEQDYMDQRREAEEVEGPRMITTQSVGIAIGALDLRL